MEAAALGQVDRRDLLVFVLVTFVFIDDRELLAIQGVDGRVNAGGFTEHSYQT